MHLSGGSKLRSNIPLRGKKKLSKTDRIASIFSSRPTENLSPKQIASELDLNIQLVTSIVNRLKDEGLIERVGWGRYKLKLEQAIDDRYIIQINHEMREMASMILGGGLDPLSDEDGNPYLELIGLYKSIKLKGGGTIASNLLRLCAKKSLTDDSVKILVHNMEEVME